MITFNKDVKKHIAILLFALNTGFITFFLQIENRIMIFVCSSLLLEFLPFIRILSVVGRAMSFFSICFQFNHGHDGEEHKNMTSEQIMKRLRYDFPFLEKGQCNEIVVTRN